MFRKSTFKMTYIAEICTQILVLPYVGQELNMVILLPRERTDLNTVTRQPWPRGPGLIWIPAGHWALGTCVQPAGRSGPTGRGAWVAADGPRGSTDAATEISYLLLQVEKALTYEKFVMWTKPDMLAEEEVEVFLPRFTLEESYDMECVLRDLGMTDGFNTARADFSGLSCQPGLHLSKVVHKPFMEVTEEGTEAVAASEARIRGLSLRTVPRFCANRPFLFFIQHSSTGAILFCGRFCSP